jgi:hypothetical protein
MLVSQGAAIFVLHVENVTLVLISLGVFGREGEERIVEERVYKIY